MAQGILSEQVTRDVVVGGGIAVNVREHGPGGSFPKQKILIGPAINEENIGRRRFVIFRRSIRYREDPNF